MQWFFTDFFKKSSKKLFYGYRGSKPYNEDEEGEKVVHVVSFWEEIFSNSVWAPFSSQKNAFSSQKNRILEKISGKIEKFLNILLDNSSFFVDDLGFFFNFCLPGKKIQGDAAYVIGHVKTL
jgi:hypothetical protein